MPLLAKSVRVLVTLLVFVASISGVGLSTESASADTVATLRFSPTSLSITTGQALNISATIENAGTETIAAGSVSIYGQSAALTQVAQLESWLAAGDGDNQPGRLLGEIDVPEIAPGDTATISGEVSSSAGLFGYTWGPRGLAASYEVAGSTISSARSAIVWAVGAAPAPAGYNIITAISAPPTGVGLLSETELKDLTSPSGILTRQLDFAASHPAVIGVDPLIVTSIKALGNAVPETVSVWLDRLRQLSKPSFLLAYADADIAIQAQVGQQTLLVPVTSDLAGTITPTPTPPADGGTVSSVFSPTLKGIGWPVANTVSESNMSVFSASGITSTILSSGNLDSGSDRPAHIINSGMPAVVTNDGFSAAVASADPSRISAYLAAAALDSSTGSVLYGALPRNSFSITQLKDVSAALAQISSQAWGQANTFSMNASTEVALINQAQSQQRADTVATIVNSTAAVSNFSSIMESPDVVTGPSSRNAADLLSAGWADQEKWISATGKVMKANRQVVQAVEIVAGSTVNMVGGQVNIPISVRNALTVPVTVIVSAESSNARLTVLSNQTIDIAAESQKSAQLAVRANASNGQATLKVSLTSPTGVPIGAQENVIVNVRAEWEGWAIGTLIVCFAGLVIVGVIRTVRKKRGPKSSS